LIQFRNEPFGIMENGFDPMPPWRKLDAREELGSTALQGSQRQKENDP
jgi:hypothetical protein